MNVYLSKWSGVVKIHEGLILFWYQVKSLHFKTFSEIYYIDAYILIWKIILKVIVYNKKYSLMMLSFHTVIYSNILIKL